MVYEISHDMFVPIKEQYNIKKTKLLTMHGSNFPKAHDVFCFFYEKLSFPPYFGFNWNALDECLQDLEWIDCDNIVIFMINSETLLYKEPLEERNILFECLYGASEYWDSQIGSIKFDIYTIR